MERAKKHSLRDAIRKR